jgi:hypothetical protein
MPHIITIRGRNYVINRDVQKLHGGASFATMHFHGTAVQIGRPALIAAGLHSGEGKNEIVAIVDNP